jgi:hypothetical protein
METLTHSNWRRVCLLAGMYMAANTETAATDQSAALGVSVTVVSSCQFDSSGTPLTGLNAYAVSAGIPAVRCGSKSLSRASDDTSIPFGFQPNYQLSSGDTQQTLTITF